MHGEANPKHDFRRRACRVFELTFHPPRCSRFLGPDCSLGPRSPGCTTIDCKGSSPCLTPHPPFHPPWPARARALSELAPGAVQSEIRAMTTECDRMGGINLAQGVCDTPVPAPVEEEAIRAIRAGHNIYTRLDGIARLRNAIAAKQQRDYGLDYDPETEVLVA